MSAIPQHKRLRKPIRISHYLVLRDLIEGIDVRQFSDVAKYLTSRIENVKTKLKKEGLEFDESAIAYSKYAPYKPYVLIRSDGNMEQAQKLLKSLYTNEIKEFLSLKDEVQESRN